MYQLILLIHVIAAVCIIALILLQQGKGADMGAAFGGGASNTVFGSAGSLPFLVKVTAILAAILFATSLVLGYLTSQAAKNAGVVKLPTSQSAPARLPKK